MEVNDVNSFSEFYKSVLTEDINLIHKRMQGGSGKESKLRKAIAELKFYTDVLQEYQYIDEGSTSKPILNIIQDTFWYLHNWETDYNRELAQSDKTYSKKFSDLHFKYKNILLGFVRRIFDNYKDIRIYSNDFKMLKQQKFSTLKKPVNEQLAVSERFLHDYSTLLRDLIKESCLQGSISNVLFDTLRKRSGLIQELQDLQPEEWFALIKDINSMESLKPSPILANRRKVAFYNPRTKKKSVLERRRDKTILGSLPDEEITEILKAFFTKIIDTDRLISINSELTQHMKTKEMIKVKALVKNLLAELQDGDEIAVPEAIAIIEEELPLQYHTSAEIQTYLKDLLEQLPDFAYVRLKKIFRRKTSTSSELAANIDRITQKKTIQITDSQQIEQRAKLQAILKTRKSIPLGKLAKKMQLSISETEKLIYDIVKDDELNIIITDKDRVVLTDYKRKLDDIKRKQDIQDRLSVERGDQKDICIICKMAVQDQERSAICPHCDSIYHYSHLQEWIKQKGTCPLCKKDLHVDSIIIKGKKK